MTVGEKKLIDAEVVDTHPHYEPYGWHHWPEFPWPSYQFRRALGETQEGGGTVSESFLAASRMIPGDLRQLARGMDGRRRQQHAARRGRGGQGPYPDRDELLAARGRHYRSAEFWLAPDDPRRMPTFDKCEKATHSFLRWTCPQGEVVDVPYEPGKPMAGYFIRSPFGGAKQPVLISFGGLDSFKDELWFMTGRGAAAARHRRC